MTTQCPCNSTLPYAKCCEPIHHNPKNAQQPVQLMRARYAAHVLGLVDFVVATYHPSCNAEQDRQAIAESIDSDWLKLEVIAQTNGNHDDEGFVEFKAYFQQDGEEYCLGERSRFVREQGQWYYIDGIFPEQEPKLDPRLQQPVSSVKIGRNDPCICGSRKKFKKCCG
ncbi:YchJ family protein [Vibrio sp. SCSIO 43136]|uniref:YchJ family protein n=1 Tax=Vibrio sp. SCSIO 43136 TaxID=2819101 RepID=UPI0020758E1C|nr:YchJ family protein [Vibrio sp. SCSIO 43136]USD64346.1 YchJ family protein [Vibrio sp. SCSIO 43136]